MQEKIGVNYQYYNGIRFYEEGPGGYYQNSTLHIRMHKYVWLCERGEIPKGMQVHHIDHNKGNNDISNLELVTAKEHARIHYDEATEERKQAIRDNLTNNARPKASEWHKSDEGKKWHSEMVKQCFADGRLGKKKLFTCQVCGKEFEGDATKHCKFCSGACKARDLRRRRREIKMSGVCVVCGKTFESSFENRDKQTCSRSCANKLGQLRSDPNYGKTSLF